MAHYDPETLILLREVLDEAWAALPDGSKSEAVKSEMAQQILKQAAGGVRDPFRLRASALVGAEAEPPPSEAKTRSKRRSAQTATFDERMASQAERLDAVDDVFTTHDLIERSRKLLSEPAPDLFLGRKTQAPIWKEEE